MRTGPWEIPRRVFHFYWAPWTFAVVGETETAAAVCSWIRREMLTEQGRIEGPCRVFDDAYACRIATLFVGGFGLRRRYTVYDRVDDAIQTRETPV